MKRILTSKIYLALYKLLNKIYPRCLEVCVPEDEVIVRAITSADYDVGESRLRSNYFKGTNKSVSRPAVSDVPRLVKRFRRDLTHDDRDPPISVIGICSIGVSNLQEMARGYKDKPVELRVVIDPCPKNLAHAIIPENITQGLSKAINDKIEKDFDLDKYAA